MCVCHCVPVWDEAAPRCLVRNTDKWERLGWDGRDFCASNPGEEPGVVTRWALNKQSTMPRFDWSV